jgi:hypothetical protein
MTTGSRKLSDPTDPQRFRATLADLDKVHVPPEALITSKEIDEVPVPHDLDEQAWVLRHAGS